MRVGVILPHPEEITDKTPNLRVIKLKQDNLNTLPSRRTYNCVHVWFFHNFVIKL